MTTKWFSLLFIAIIGIMLLLFRPDQLLRTNMLYPGDDYSYLAHASSLAFGQFPDYSKEAFTLGESKPLNSIGSGIMAAPFVWALSRLDVYTAPSILTKRTTTNLNKSWSVFGFFLSTQIYFYITCILFYFILLKYFPPQCVFWSIFFMVLLQGIPLYVFRRPIFSHIDVLFLHATFLYLCTYGLNWNNKAQMYLNSFFIGLLCALTFLVRYEHIIFALLYPFIIFILNSTKPLKQRFIYLICAYTLACIIISYFILSLDTVKSIAGYCKFVRVIHTKDIFYYIARLKHLIFGIDWGLIFTAPFILCAFFGLRSPAAFKGYWLLLCALAVDLIIVLQWTTQGGWYGYRYLIFSAVPILMLPFAYVVNLALRQRALFIIILLLGIMPFLSMLCFEGVSDNLKLSIVKQYFNYSGWGNNQYQWEVIKTAVDLKAMTITLLRGVPLYIMSLLSAIFFPNQAYFSNLRELSFSFNLELTLKVFITLALPILILLIIKLLSKDHLKFLCSDNTRTSSCDKKIKDANENQITHIKHSK